MKRVLSAPNAAEAHVAVAVLESAGIEAVIRGEYMGALPLGAISSPSVWVRDEDYDAACEALGVPANAAQATESSAPPYRLMLIVIIALALFLSVQRC